MARTYKIERSARRSVYRRDGYACRECGWTPPVVNEDEKATFRRGNYALTLDHIIPRSRGGTNVQSNLQTLCLICNIAKGNGFSLDPLRRENLVKKYREKAQRRKSRGRDDQHHILPRFQNA